MTIGINTNAKPNSQGPSSKGIDDVLFEQFAKGGASKTDASNSSGSNISEKADTVVNVSGDRRILAGDHAANEQAKVQEEAQDVISKAIRSGSGQFGSII